MHRGLFSIVVLGVVVATPVVTQAEVEVKWFGFAQLTAEARDQDKPNDGLRFDADRIRIGFKLKEGKIFGKLQIDFMKNTNRNAGNTDLPAIIKDAEVGYKFSNAASLKIGQFKTPLGMDFNNSGKKLDLTKRGMEKGLVLERAVGIMLSGRKMNGFGYDIGIFNPAARSAADAKGTRGKDNSYVGRLMYDSKGFHVEGAYGVDQTSTAGKSKYSVWDIAGSYKSGPWTFKAEYISGDNVDGDATQDEEVWFVHGGYKFNKRFEAVMRFYTGDHTTAGVKTDLSNTFVGMNFFMGSKAVNGRLQVNYVFAGGDTGGAYKGQRGYKDDALLVQYQVSF
ncbi:MAG: porin [Gammaproteobacteria bacterium]